VQRSGPARVTSRGLGAPPRTESIDHGLVLLVCAETGDDGAVFDWAADKVARMRLFEDDAGKMNRSVLDTGGQVMVVSQFTLAGDAGKGNRPSFVGAAPRGTAEPLVERFASRLEHAHGLTVARGVFGASMDVELVNEGPVTIILDRRAGGASA